MNHTAKWLQAATTESTNKPFPWNMLQRMALPDDPDQRVDATAAAMCAMIHHAAATCEAAHLLNELLWEHSRGEASTRAEHYQTVLWLYLKRHHVFTPDPDGEELLRHPAQLLEESGSFQLQWHGDCDDVAMLAGTLLVINRIPCRIVVIARVADQPFEHVYVEGKRYNGDDGAWNAIDPQETNATFEERQHARRREYPVFL
jgi:transglutaminase-like putative cysteine protease